jgi:PAB1-binding protein PBP1
MRAKKQVGPQSLELGVRFIVNDDNIDDEDLRSFLVAAIDEIMSEIKCSGWSMLRGYKKPRNIRNKAGEIVGVVEFPISK